MIYLLTLRFFFLLITCSFLVESAPVQESIGRQPRQKGCYYLSDHYDNGERIDTNEPCLNCTCLNSMLMCYLRICPFVKPVGEECIIEREEGDCCPKIWCPEVIKNKENTPKISEKRKQQPGCYLDDKFYSDGAMLPHDPKRPCEVCYCIRNSTACVMQECELKVDGCFPIYKEGQCCPCRYNCTYEEATPTPPGVTLTDLAEGCTLSDGSFVEDGEAVNSTNPCEHCYCMRNEVVCAIQECQAPGDNCRPVPPKPDQCCPDRYECLVNTISPNSFEKPISLQFSTVFTTSLGTTTTSPDLATVKGKIADSSKVKGAPKKEVIDEIPSPVYIPSQQTKSSEIPEEIFTTVSISQKSSTVKESHIQENVTLIPTLSDTSSLASSTESEVAEKIRSFTITPADDLLSDKFSATSSEKISTEYAETTGSILSDEKISELTTIHYETSSPADQSQQTTIQAEAINPEEHYKKVTTQEEKSKPTEYSQQTTIQGDISSTTEYYQKSTTEADTKTSIGYSPETTILVDTRSPIKQSQQTTAQTKISHPTEISQDMTSETQPSRKGYGVKGSSLTHKSSSVHTPSSAPENVEVSTESYSPQKSSSPLEYDTSRNSTNTILSEKEKADSVKESTFSPPNIIRVKGRKPSSPSEESIKVSTTEPTVASQEHNFMEGEPEDGKIKQPTGEQSITGVKSSQKKGQIKGKRPQIKEKPLLPVGVIPGEKKQSTSTTVFPSIKGRPSVMSIPGEGSCHVGKVTYKHGQAVPSSDVCKMSCQCSRGKIYCVEIVCEKLHPENYGECQLVRNQSQCCPHYECGTSITKPAEYLDITEFTSVDGIFISSTTVQKSGTYTTESSTLFPISSTESTDDVFKTDATTTSSPSSFTKEATSSSFSSKTPLFSTFPTEISHSTNEVDVSTTADDTNFSISIHEEELSTEQSHSQEETETTTGSTKLFSVASTSQEAETASVSYDSTVEEIKYTTQETSTSEKESAKFTSTKASTESPTTEKSHATPFTFKETDSEASTDPSTELHSTPTVKETSKTTFEDLTVEKIAGVSTTMKTSSFSSVQPEEQTETPEVGIHTETEQKSSTPSDVISTSEVITERYSQSDLVKETESIQPSGTAEEISTLHSVTSTKVSVGSEVTDKFGTVVTDKDAGATLGYEISSDKEETFLATSSKPLETSETQEDFEKLTDHKTTIISTYEESSVTPLPEEAAHEAESSFQTDTSLQEKFTIPSTKQTGHSSTQEPFVDLTSTEKTLPSILDLSSTKKHQPTLGETAVSDGADTKDYFESTVVVVSSTEAETPEYIPKTVIASNVSTIGLIDASETTASKVATEESHLAETTTVVTKVDLAVSFETDLPSDLHAQDSSTEKNIVELQTTSSQSAQTTKQQDGTATSSVQTSTGSNIVYSTDAPTSYATHSTTLKEHDITDSTERTTEQSYTIKSTEIQKSTEAPTTTQKDTEEHEKLKTASGIYEEHEVTFSTKKEQEETTFHVFKHSTTDSYDITTRSSEHPQGTSTITPVKDDISTVISTTTSAQQGLSSDIIGADSSDDSVKFTETKPDSVSSTEGTETSSKQETDAGSDISHEIELTTLSSKSEESSTTFSVGTNLSEETSPKQETDAETDRSDEAELTSLSPKAAESSSTFEDSSHFAVSETSVTQKIDIVSGIGQQEQSSTPSSTVEESEYSTTVRIESLFHDATEAPKSVEETDVSPITSVSEDKKTTSKLEESTEEGHKEEFSGINLDSEVTDKKISESEFSTSHAEEIRSSSVSGASSTQASHELDYDTKSSTSISVTISEQDNEETSVSVEGSSTTGEEKLPTSEEILSPIYEITDNEISHDVGDFVTEFHDSGDGKYEDEGIFSKKKPGKESDIEANEPEKHTTESHAEVIKHEQHITESHVEATDLESHTESELHAESIKPEQHTTASHIELIEPEQHTTELQADYIKSKQHSTESYITIIELEQHTTESYAESIKPEQHSTQSHIEIIEPEQKYTTESHAETAESEQHGTELYLEVSTFASEASESPEEAAKTQAVATHIPESTAEEKETHTVETSSEKEIHVSHEYQKTDSQFPAIQVTSTNQPKDDVYITESEDYEHKKVSFEASVSYEDTTSQGVTEKSEISTDDLSETHKSQDHAEKFETIISTSSTVSSSDHGTSTAKQTLVPSSTEKSTFEHDSVTTVESIKSTSTDVSHTSESLIEVSDTSTTDDSTSTLKPGESLESFDSHKDEGFKPFSVESTSLPIMIIDDASTLDDKAIQTESPSPSTNLSHEDIVTTQEPYHSVSTSTDQPKKDEILTDEKIASIVTEDESRGTSEGISISESTEYHSETTDKTSISSTHSHHDIVTTQEPYHSVSTSTDQPKENGILPDEKIASIVTEDESRGTSEGISISESTEYHSETTDKTIISPTHSHHETSYVPEKTTNAITDASNIPNAFAVSTSEPENLVSVDATGSTAQEEAETVKGEYKLKAFQIKWENGKQGIDRHTNPENVEGAVDTVVSTAYESIKDAKDSSTVKYETTERPTTVKKVSTTVSESTTTAHPGTHKDFASTSVAGDLTSIKISEHSEDAIVDFNNSSHIVDHSEDEETIETFTDPPKQTEKPESHIKLSHTHEPSISVEEVTSTAAPQTPAISEKPTDEKMELTVETTQAVSEESHHSFVTSKAPELTSEPVKSDTHVIFSSDSTVVPTIVHSGTTTFTLKPEVITQTVQTPVLLETTQFTPKESSPTEHEAIEDLEEEEAESLPHVSEKDDLIAKRITPSAIDVSDVSKSSELTTAKILEEENNSAEDSGKFTDHEKIHTDSITTEISEETTAKEEQTTLFASTPKSVSTEESHDHSVLPNATEAVSTDIHSEFHEQEKTSFTVSAQTDEASTSASFGHSTNVFDVTDIENKLKTTLISEFSDTIDTSTKSEKIETSSIRVEEDLINTEYSELQKHSTAAPTENAPTSESYFSAEDSSLTPKIKVISDETATHAATGDYADTVKETETSKSEITTKEYNEQVNSSNFIHQEGDETTYDSSNEQSELDVEAEFQTSPKPEDGETISTESGIKHSTSFVEQSEETDESFEEHADSTSTTKTVPENKQKEQSASTTPALISVRDGPSHSTLTTIYDLTSTPKPLKLDAVIENQHSTSKYFQADAEIDEKFHETDKYLDKSTTQDVITEIKPSILPVTQSRDEAVKDSSIKQITEKYEDSESTDYEGWDTGSTTSEAKEFTATTSDDVSVKTTESKQLSSDILAKDSITDHDKTQSSSTFSPEIISEAQKDTEVGLTDTDSKTDAVYLSTTKYPQETGESSLVTEETREIFGSTKTHLLNDTKDVSLPENFLTDSDIINEITSSSDSKLSSENVPDLTHISLAHTTDKISTQDHGFHKQTYPPESLDEGLEENIKFFTTLSTIQSDETILPENLTTESAERISSLSELSSDVTETSLDKHKTDAESLSITKESIQDSDSDILTVSPSLIPENLIDFSIIPSQQDNLQTVDTDTTYVNQENVEKKPFEISSTTVTEVNKLEESHSNLTNTVDAFEIELANQTLHADDQKEAVPSFEDSGAITSDSKVTKISDTSAFETSSSTVSPTQDYGFHKEVYYPPKHEESTKFVQHYDTTELPTSFSTLIDESATQKSEIIKSTVHSDSTFASVTDTQTEQSVNVDRKSAADFGVTSIKESTVAQKDLSSQESTIKIAETTESDSETSVTHSEHASSTFSTGDITLTPHTGSVSETHSLDEVKQKPTLHAKTTISSNEFFTTEYSKSSSDEDQNVTDQSHKELFTEEPHIDMNSSTSIQTISTEETEKKKESVTVSGIEISSTSRKPTDYDYLYTTYISHISSSVEFSEESDSFSTTKPETTDTVEENATTEEQHSTHHVESGDSLTTVSDNVANENISEESTIHTKFSTDYAPALLINDTTTDRTSDPDSAILLKKTTIEDIELSSTTESSIKESFDAEVHSTENEISSKIVTSLPKQTDIHSTHVTELFNDNTRPPQENLHLDHSKTEGVISTQDYSDLHTEFSFNDEISEHHGITTSDESDIIITKKLPSVSVEDQFSTFSSHQNESFTETIHETTKSYEIKNEEGISEISETSPSSSTIVTIEALGVSRDSISSTHITTSTSFETTSNALESSLDKETQPEGAEKIYDIESFTIKDSLSNHSDTKVVTDSTITTSYDLNLSEDQDKKVTIKSFVSDSESAFTEEHSTYSPLFVSTTTKHAVDSTTAQPQTSTSSAVDISEASLTTGTSKSQEDVTISAHDTSSSTTHEEILETIASFFPHSSPPSILAESHKSSSLSSSSTTSGPSHKHTTAKPADESPHHLPEDGYCLYENEVYNSAEQIPRKDPCEFCFCFRGDIICLQQSCPPPIRGCYATPINGFCCPRFHCPVQEMHFNLSTTTTTTPDPRIGKYLPPADQNTGCEIEGNVYRVHQVVRPSSGPCMLCRCEMGGIMKCDPRDCQPQAPLLLRLNREFFKKR
ncbi:serine-rich adhesin for platelets-like [Argiope bruennichi]|uniref:serine-rich adhesin for platelets-like n=1 Tax=Argiope bruennichi TaxID=94029 RepID=UPI002494A37A|nr:serine-rich adhesin for platelets-like [Argiope bruennichi]